MLVLMLWMVPLAAFPGVEDGLVAHYAFEGDFDDDSGDGNHATPNGGVGLVSGWLGQAASFDGIDDYVTTPASTAGDFSVSFWVRTSAVAPAATDWWAGFGLVDAEVCGSPPDGDWGVALLNGGHAAIGVGVLLESVTVVNDDRWHSAGFSRVQNGEVRLYVDGREEASAASGPSPLSGVPWIGLGNNPCDVAFGRLFFPGLLDEVRYYDRALAPEEMVRLGALFADDFESGDTSAWSSTAP